jgi:dipeptidyl aminopeptidase/acylaminoacyl peptidase
LVPPKQGERLDAALRQAGVESKLIVFADEGHLILKKEDGERVIQEALAFFQKHLSP